MFEVPVQAPVYADEYFYLIQMMELYIPCKDKLFYRGAPF